MSIGHKMARSDRTARIARGDGRSPATCACRQTRLLTIMVHRCRVLLLLALVAPCAFAQVPMDTVRVFYSWVLAHPSRGLPSGGERAQLAKVLSPRLIRLLEQASEMEGKCIARAPKGDKPLIIEGDLFVGNYEGATEVVYGEPRRSGDRVTVESDLFYVDNRFPKAHKHRAVAWRDRIEMRLLADGWYVDDVHFQRDRTLAAALQAYLAEGKRSCMGSGSAQGQVSHRDEVLEVPSYLEAIRRWRAPEHVNAWIAARFRYDDDRAVLLSENRRALHDAPVIYAPQAFFAEPSGVCVDLARFAVETLRAIAPELAPNYLLFEFEPAVIAGDTYRLHWVASFERSGMRYFFADSSRPGHIAGPYATTQEYVDDYAQYRGRRIVSFKELASFQRRMKMPAQGQKRVEGFALQ